MGTRPFSSAALGLNVLRFVQTIEKSIPDLSGLWRPVHSPVSGLSFPSFSINVWFISRWCQAFTGVMHLAVPKVLMQQVSSMSGHICGACLRWADTLNGMSNYEHGFHARAMADMHIISHGMW